MSESAYLHHTTTAELLGYKTPPDWVTGVSREAFILTAMTLSMNDAKPIDPCAARRVRIEVEMFA